LPKPRPSAHTAMFTISPGEERALEEHGAGETAKSGFGVRSRSALSKGAAHLPRLKLFSEGVSKRG
jgi:hypothetical protein